MLKIAMIAGEASGDSLAADLMKVIKLNHANVDFVGIGGAKMQKEGFVSWHDMSQLSIIGITEVLKNLPQLLWLRYKIIQQIIAYKPDIFIGVDAPDFNFYIEKKLKDHGIRTIHYISPSLWAWRYDRIFKIKKSTDIVLCLFTFEPAIYAEQGILAEFIGHPLAASIEFAPDTQYYRRELLNLDDSEEIIITILCGSRRHEIIMLLEESVKAANIFYDKLQHHNPSVVKKFRVLFPVSLKMSTVIKYELEALISKNININFAYNIIIDNTLSAIKACDLALVKSGTVSLEVALCKKPMVVFYKLQKLSAYFIAKRIKISFVGLANIIAEKMKLPPIVPELLQEQANGSKLAEELFAIYNDKKLQQDMVDNFQKIHIALQQPQNYFEIINSIIKKQ